MRGSGEGLQWKRGDGGRRRLLTEEWKNWKGGPMLGAHIEAGKGGGSDRRGRAVEGARPMVGPDRNGAGSSGSNTGGACLEEKKTAQAQEE
jgi:hypothetical protein